MTNSQNEAFAQLFYANTEKLERIQKLEAKIKNLELVVEAANILLSHIIPGENQYTKATVKVHCDQCGEIEACLSDKADEAYDRLVYVIATLEVAADGS